MIEIFLITIATLFAGTADEPCYVSYIHLDTGEVHVCNIAVHFNPDIVKQAYYDNIVAYPENQRWDKFKEQILS